MTENKENKNFLTRWSDKKSGVEKEQLNKKSAKKKKQIKNQILESDIEIDKKYSKLSDKEILDKLKLPDPNKIKKEKDLDVFFKKSIPERLKRIAMRRLWRINPVISFADAEINDYADDFTDAATVIEDLQTSYIVGEGHLKSEIEKVLETENKVDDDGKKDKIKTNKISKKTEKIDSKKVLEKEGKKYKFKKHKQEKSLSKGTKQKSLEKDNEIKSPEEQSIQHKYKPKNLIFTRKA